MNVFVGRPDLLLLFVAQIAFIIVQLIIFLRISRAEKKSSQRAAKTTKKIISKTTPAKRKLRRSKK